MTPTTTTPVTPAVAPPDMPGLQLTAAIPRGASARFEVVTPDMARTWLATMGPNRKVSALNVRILIGQLKAGLWQATHQGIAFDSSNRLLDGQHRLEAIVTSGIPAVLLVVRGISREAFSVVDRQHPRRLADTFSTIGRDNNKVLAATVRRLFALVYHNDAGVSMSRESAPEDMLVDLERNTPGLLESVAWAVSHSNKVRLVLTLPLAAVIHFTAKQFWPDRRDFEVFIEGEGLPKHMADLRDRLTSDRQGAPMMRGKIQRTRLTDTEVFALVMRLLNKHASGDYSRVVLAKDDHYQSVLAGKRLRRLLWGSEDIPGRE